MSDPPEGYSVLMNGHHSDQISIGVTTASILDPWYRSRVCRPLASPCCRGGGGGKKEAGLKVNDLKRCLPTDSRRPLNPHNANDTNNKKKCEIRLLNKKEEAVGHVCSGA